MSKKRIDGLVLFVKNDEQRRTKDETKKLGAEAEADEDVYIDECCLTDYYGSAADISSFNMNINFLIPNTKYILTFGVTNEEKLE